MYIVGTLRLERRSFSLAGLHVAEETNFGSTGTLGAGKNSRGDRTSFHCLFSAAVFFCKPGAFPDTCPRGGSVLGHDLPAVGI